MRRLLTSFSVFVLLIAAVSTRADGRFFESDGVRIQYYDEGKGVPLVMLHGGAGSAAFWSEDTGPDFIGYDLQGALVAAGYRVLAIDLRGYGKSDKPHSTSAYGFEMSRDVVRLLDHLDIEKAHVMGYAQGGLIGNWMRRENPDRMLTMTMCSGGLMPEDSFWVIHADEFADGIAKLDMTPIVREMTPPGHPVPSPEEVHARYADMFEKIDMQALSAMVRAQALPDSPEELRSNTVPTLIFIGEHDHNRRDVTVLANHMSSMEMMVLPGASHQQAVREPTFLAEFLKFIDRSHLSKEDHP